MSGFARKLGTTMVYARAYGQTVAEDYFAAMQRVEERLQIVSVKEDVRVQELFQLIQKLETPELELVERLGIASRLRCVMDNIHQHAPPL